MSVFVCIRKKLHHALMKLGIIGLILALVTAPNRFFAVFTEHFP